MIKNPDVLRQFEDRFIRDEKKRSFDQSIRLFTSMWNEGLKLGVLPPEDPLEGIEVDIKIAAALNSCLKKYSQG